MTIVVVDETVERCKREMRFRRSLLLERVFLTWT